MLREQATGLSIAPMPVEFGFATSIERAPSGEPAIDRGGSINARQGQHALQDRAQANEHHEQLEKVCQSAVAGESVDGPETDRSDDDNNQNPDQNRNH
jgi:hypothetical protein